MTDSGITLKQIIARCMVCGSGKEDKAEGPILILHANHIAERFDIQTEEEFLDWLADSDNVRVNLPNDDEPDDYQQLNLFENEENCGEG